MPKKAQTKAKDPAFERFLADSARVADALVSAMQERMTVLGTENQTLHKELATDELTGRLNERGLHATLERRKASSGKFVLMYVDVNRFKEINDKYGHDVGDMVIRETAKHLEGLVRRDDVVARLHGDEFVVVFMDATEAGVKRKFGPKKLGFVVGKGQYRIPVSLSAGIAAQKRGESIRNTLRRADQAMYMMKRRKGAARN
jgi:diguanylate cyclase (GGDEF)-like protein